MSLEINVKINADDQGNMTKREQAVLAALAFPSGGEPKAAVETPKAEVTETASAVAAEPAAEEPTPVKKRSPRRSTSRAAVLEDTPDAEPTPEPEQAEAPKAAEPEEAEEDLLGTSDEAKEYTKQDAVDAATKLVGDSKASVVKRALEASGASRVTELKGAAIQVFMDALNSDEG